jgi:hypothetical protein
VDEVIDPSGGTDFRQITKLAKGFSGISPSGPFGCISHHMFHIAGRTQADIESHMQPECVGGTRWGAEIIGAQPQTSSSSR